MNQNTKKNALILELKAMGITNAAVLDAIQRVSREQFIAPEYLSHAYENKPIGIDCGQTISQPYIVAQMTQLLIGDGQKPLNKILEIGTGSGYQAAILSQLATQIYSIERHYLLHEKTKKLLVKLGYDNIFLKHGDGFEGWEEHAPYDGIIVTAAPEEIPQALLNQLSEDYGRLVIPVGQHAKNQELQLIIRSGKNNFEIQNIEAVRFVPMLSGKDFTEK